MNTRCEYCGKEAMDLAVMGSGQTWCINCVMDSRAAIAEQREAAKAGAAAMVERLSVWLLGRVCAVYKEPPPRLSCSCGPCEITRILGHVDPNPFLAELSELRARDGAMQKVIKDHCIHMGCMERSGSCLFEHDRAFVLSPETCSTARRLLARAVISADGKTSKEVNKHTIRTASPSPAPGDADLMTKPRDLQGPADGVPFGLRCDERQNDPEKGRLIEQREAALTQCRIHQERERRCMQLLSAPGQGDMLITAVEAAVATISSLRTRGEALSEEKENLRDAAVDTLDSICQMGLVVNAGVGNDERRKVRSAYDKLRVATGKTQGPGLFHGIPAPMASPPEPLQIRLVCESCGELHIDEGEYVTKAHHTHACQHCGHTWRPAVPPTVGVRFLPGFKNDPSPTPEKD